MASKPTALMMRTEMVIEVLVYSPFRHRTWLLARECFIEFSHRESIRLCKLSCTIQALYEMYCTVHILKVIILEHTGIVTKDLNFLLN
jgi:hypothetical protein